MSHKIKKRGKLKIISLVWNIMALSIFFIFWQGQDVRAEKSLQDAAPSQILSGNSTGDKPEKKDWQKRHTYVYEQDFGQDYYLKGLFDRGQMYFNVGKWDVDEAVFVLEMNNSQLINTEVSYYTVSLNGRPVYTESLSELSEPSAFRVIPLPAEALQMDGVNGITVEAYLRGQNTDACVDDSAISAWMNILKESKVLLGYESAAECSDIAEFYQRFLSIEALDNEQSMVGTGRNAGEEVLTVIANVISGISGSAALGYDRIQTGLIESRLDILSFPYLIYVNTYGQLPEYISSGMSDVQKKYAQEGAVVCFLEQEGTKLLVVTGNDEAALINAGNMLSNPGYMKTLYVTEQAVDDKSEFYTEKYKFEEYLYLTADGTQVKGSFEQKASFGIDCPPNRTMAYGSQLSLDFRYSENLDFDKSLLTVLIDGIPIGSRRLSKEGAQETTELFHIPGDLQISGGFTVDTVFQLYPEGEWCELTPEEIPWGYVAETSMIKYASRENKDLYFEHYPAPFIEDGSFRDTRVLLPEDWTEADLKTMGGVLLTLGRYQKSNRGNLAVMVNPAEERLLDLNLISIGEKGKNTISMSGSQAINRSGAAQLIPSPYGETVHSILIITGGNSEGMQTTLNYLGKAEHLWELRGDTFVTDGKALNCYYKNPPSAVQEPPAGNLPEAEEEKAPLLGAAAIMILILIASIMIIFKYRRVRRDDEP